LSTLADRRRTPAALGFFVGELTPNALHQGQVVVTLPNGWFPQP